MLRLGSIDREVEAKLLRRQEREAAEERQKEKEKQRLASSTAVSSLINIDGSDDESIADEGIGDESEEYQPSSKGHERVRSKTVKLEIDVDKYRKSFSLHSDHRKISSRGRCDILSEQVMSGGVDLRSVPCSKTTMIRLSNNAK